MNPTDSLTILLIEDDDVAAEAVMRSLTKANVHFPVVWAEDGLAALEILRGQSPNRKVPRPRVLLLDLNMPRMNGFEFLQTLRADPALNDEIVFVLTTSDEQTDRHKAYQENIAGYMVKSCIGPQFSKLAALLQNYQAAVRLP
jgi:CheY-like chemotaxis protein